MNPESVRHAILEYLEQQRTSLDGAPLEVFFRHLAIRNPKEFFLNSLFDPFEMIEIREFAAKILSLLDPPLPLPDIMQFVRNNHEHDKLRGNLLEVLGTFHFEGVIPHLQLFLHEIPQLNIPLLTEITPEWLIEDENRRRILSYFKIYQNKFQFRAQVAKVIGTLNMPEGSGLLFQEFEEANGPDLMYNMAHRILHIVPQAAKIIYEGPIFLFIKAKIDFQRAVLKSIGILQDPTSVQPLFEILLHGSSRFWNDALNALTFFKNISVLERLLHIYEEVPDVWARVSPHRDYLLRSDLVSFLDTANERRLRILKSLLIDQGPKNLPRLEFIQEKTQKPELKNLLTEIVRIIQPHVELSTGHLIFN